MKPLSVRKSCAGLALLLLSGSGWALPIKELHFINANDTRPGKEGKEVGYTSFYVSSEGYFNLTANRVGNAFVNPYLYLFGNAQASPDNWNLVASNNDDQTDRQKANFGYNARLDRIFLGIGNYIAALSDIGGPQWDNGTYLPIAYDFTEEEARGGYNEDVAALGNRSGRMSLRLNAPVRPNDGRRFRVFDPYGNVVDILNEERIVYHPDAFAGVPEPGTLFLLGSGAVMLGFANRRRSRRGRRAAGTAASAAPQH